MKFHRIAVFILLNIAVIITTTALISFFLKEQQVSADEKRLGALYTQILDGASNTPVDVTIDYASPVSVGSPLVFGGSHAPLVEHQDAWDKIAEAGVTSIRKDLFMERAIPDTTIDNYKRNIGGVADIKNWKQNEINNISAIFENARKRNMKTIGILAYTPGWLTYTGTGNGVPKDWGVFEDITKKTYQIHRNHLDYLEIWNEPNFDYFLNPAGSGISQDIAYQKMFTHAVKAIREVDNEINDGKKIAIGGPVGYDPFKTSTLEKIVSNKDLVKDLDFVSYHNYDAKHLKEPSWDNYKRILTKYNVANKPIYITEWNYEPDDKAPTPKNTGVPALLYTADKFFSFLTMGLTGANYHVLEPLNKNKPNNGEGYYGFYKWENGQAELQPQAKTWRLLSNKMGLGKGASKIFLPKTGTAPLKTIGFINAAGQEGLALINDTETGALINLNLANGKPKNYIKTTVYQASEAQDATAPLYEGLTKAKEGNVTGTFYVPAQTVMGILFTEEKEWFELPNLIH